MDNNLDLQTESTHQPTGRKPSQTLLDIGALYKPKQLYKNTTYITRILPCLRCTMQWLWGQQYKGKNRSYMRTMRTLSEGLIP